MTYRGSKGQKENAFFNFRNMGCSMILVDSYTFGSQKLCKDFETLIVTAFGKTTTPVSSVSKPGNQNNEISSVLFSQPIVAGARL